MTPGLDVGQTAPAILAVVNPHAANGRAGRHWPRLRSRLEEVLGPLAVVLTRGPGEATSITREALERDACLIIAVGGDGTVSEVVDGFFTAEGPLNPHAALAPLSVGTGGDLRRYLRRHLTEGDPRDPRGLARRCKAGSGRKVDVGRLTYIDRQGGERVRHFINIASFGIGGLVDAKVNAASKVFGGRISFIIATIRAMREYRNKPVHLVVDDTFDEHLKINNVAVANGQYFGGGMWVAPRASMDDGQFDIVILGDLNWRDFLFRGYRIYRGTHLVMDKVRCLRGRRVRAESDEEVLLDVDGEQPGRLPATFEILPGALTLMV